MEAVVAFSIALVWKACDGSDIQMATAQGKRGETFIPTSRDRDRYIYTFHLDASALLTMAGLPFREQTFKLQASSPTRCGLRVLTLIDVGRKHLPADTRWPCKRSFGLHDSPL